MFMRNKTISLLIFFICFISFYSQEADKNWTIKNNSINIFTYVSNLTDEERENYYYWIGLRNSFYYSKNSNQLEKLVKYFKKNEVIKLKIIPLEKQSKKAQREFHAKQRGGWNGVKPVTRVVESKKAYDRKKMRGFDPFC